MLVAELDAAVRWPDGNVLQGLVKMNYLQDVDPWLVHMTFVVAEARDDLEIERTALLRIGLDIEKAQWLNLEGAPFQMAVGPGFVRMRLTDPETGAYVDYDVRREEMKDFLRGTVEKVNYVQERAALNAYIETGLERLT